MTGHTEVVLVVFDPKVTSYDALLKIFWENHDPTQGMQQGNDVGAAPVGDLPFSPEQKRAAERRARPSRIA
jgi:peptide-methionine (S)-S-oxide reductase